MATALQMISWGLKVNDYGNAILDNGNFIKQKEKGVTEDLWADMLAYAKTNDLTGGNFKKLNLPFENKFLAQPKKIRDRMAKDVEEFVYGLLTRVFNATDTAQFVIDEILKNQSCDPGFKTEKIESKNDWTKEKIIEKALSITTDKGQEGDFDD